MRLFRALDRARRRRAAWLWAPAGSGKTTLLATYVASRRVPAIFYRVDRSDVDIAAVFQFLSEAWTRRPGRSARALPLPRFTPEVGDVRAFARQLFAAMGAEVTARGAALVFDDAHEVPDEALLWQVLRVGLDVLPESVCILVASRRSPPPVFARGVAHGDIDVLSFEALKLRPAESAGVLEAKLGASRRLGSDAARALHARSGGWAAGLLMLASAIRADAPEREGALQVASRQRLFDYFATEVFAAMPLIHRRVAIRAAVTEAVDPDIAAELVGPQQRRALASFSRELPLVERHGREWRFHPLFRAFLLAKASDELGAEGLRELRRRACAALLRRGRPDEAFEIAKSSGDAETLRNVVATCAPALLEQGRALTVEVWTSELSREAVYADPRLSLLRGQAIWMRSPGEALSLFAAAQKTDDRDCAALACAGALQANAFAGEDFSRLDSLLDAVLALDPPTLAPGVTAQVTVAVIGSIGFRRPGDPRAVPFVRHAHRLARASPNERLRRSLAGMLVFHELFFGDPAEADNLVSEILAAGSRPSDPLSQITVLLAGGLQSWLKGAVDDALSSVRLGLDVAAASGIHVWDDQLNAIGAAATIAGERRAAAQGFLDNLSAAAGRSRFASGNADFYRAWAALSADDADSAGRHGARAYRAARDVGSPFAQMLTATLMGRVALVTGAVEEASRYLEQAGRDASAVGSPLSQLPLHAARAELAAITGQRDAELGALGAFFATTRTTGVTGFFLVGRRDMARCAWQALWRGVEPAAARSLASALTLEAPREARLLGRWPWAVRVRAFGPLAVELAGRDGIAAPIRGDRTRQLLALLVALGPRPVAQTLIADELWPDAEGDAARARLDTTLLRLRRQLGPRPTIRLHEGRLSIDRDAVFVDLFAADELLQRVDRALAEGHADRAAEALAEVLALVGQPLFANLEGPTLDQRRKTLDRRLAAVLRKAAEHARHERGERPLGRLVARADVARNVT